MCTLRTAKKKRAFLEALKGCGNVTLACKLVGIPRMTAYGQRTVDPGFAAEWDSAVVEYAEVVLEPEADRRAVEGTERPVFYKGDECGSVREFSDLLMIFRLKALKPDVYRERQSLEVSAPGGGPVQIDAKVELISRIAGLVARAGEGGVPGGPDEAGS